MEQLIESNDKVEGTCGAFWPCGASKCRLWQTLCSKTL